MIKPLVAQVFLTRALVFATLFFWFFSFAHAAIDLVDVDDDTASYFIGIGSNNADGDSATIFGGTAGSNRCSGDGDSTCNNCDTENPAINEVCNEKQVYSTLELRIRFSSDQADGVTAIADEDGNIISGLDIIDEQDLSAGSEHTAIVEWGDICSALLGINANCTEDATGTLSIGVNSDGDSDLNDTDDDRTTISIVVQNTIEAEARICDDADLGINDGLCNFSVFPGDEKIFLQNAEVPDGFPSAAGGADHILVRLFGVIGNVADGDSGSTIFSSITHNDKLGDLEIEKDDDDDLSLTPNSLDGLTNGSEYFVVAATVDEAQNVGFHTPLNRIDNGSQYLTRGVHTAVPQPVSALLTEDFQCFIASAAYGSPFTEQVKVLRKFRNQILSPHWLGRKLVKLYYRWSPPIAEVVAANPVARQLVRWALLPLGTLARWSLNVGRPWTLSLAALWLSGLALLPWLIARQRKRRA